jgi:FkbM family methyltransferase
MKTEHLAAMTRRIVDWKGGYRTSHALINWHLRKCRPPVEYEVMGFRMLLNPQECVDQALLFYPQLYEAAELDYVKSHLRPGDTFIDIGSHIGLYSLLASATVGPTGRVVAVDADPDTYGRLGQNLRLNSAGNVQPYNYGVSGERGSLPLFRWTGTGPNAGANTFIPRQEPGDDWTAAGEIQCVTLLDVLTLAQVRSINGLKLDIERAEYKVLSRFFSEAPALLLPSFILFEEYKSTIELAGGSVVRLLESDGRYRRLMNANAMKRDHIFELIVT